MKQSLIILCMFLSLYSFSQHNPHYTSAKIFREKGELQNALSEIDKAILQDSLNIDHLNLKAGVLAQLERYQESFDLYSRVISINGKDIHAYNERGLLLYAAQQFSEAINDFSNGLMVCRADSDRNLLLVNRAAANIKIRQFQPAYDDLLTVYNNDSSDLGMLVNLAAICDEIGKGNETLKYLERVVKIDPEYFPAYINIGFKYQDMGDHRAAIKYFDAALKLSPKEALGFSNRSFSKLKLGDIAGAHSDIGASLAIDPSNSYAYRIRALIYIEQGNNERACQDIEQALKLGFTEMYGDEVKQLQAKYCH